MPKDNPNIKERISALEAEVRNLKDRFEDFVINDFKHLRNKVEGIENKILWGFILMIAITVLTQIILRVFG